MIRGVVNFNLCIWGKPFGESSMKENKARKLSSQVVRLAYSDQKNILLDSFAVKNQQNKFNFSHNMEPLKVYPRRILDQLFYSHYISRIS